MEVERRIRTEHRERVENAIEAAALDAARDAARGTARRAAGGYFLLLLFLLIGAAFYQRAFNQRLDRDALLQCQRVQTQRERANVSEARQYLLLRAVAESPRASPKVKDQYTELYTTTLYDPPTDCPAAVKHPGSYRRPPSVPFYAVGQKFPQALVKAAKDKRLQPTLNQ